MDSKIANEIFKYDPDTGRLYWKIKPCRNVALGAEIKSERTQGYLGVGYKGKNYLVHRIIWLMVYGSFPNGHIDHIDHNKQNNKLENLRDVSVSSNQRNRSISTKNTSGFVGVHFDKKSQKWVAKGMISGGTRKQIGMFARKEDAIEARKAFNRENGYHPNHGSQ